MKKRKRSRDSTKTPDGTQENRDFFFDENQVGKENEGFEGMNYEQKRQPFNNGNMSQTDRKDNEMDETRS